MMIKRILTAGLALLCAAGGLSAQEQTVDGAFGGVYRKVVKPDEGEMAREGQIVVIFSEKGVWFNAFLSRADGHTAALKPEGGTWFEKTGEGRDFSYNWVDDNFDYTMEVKIPSPEALTIIDHFNAGASPFGMGMSLGGDYELDYGYVVDVNGYVYQKVAEGTALELCAGGIYKGTVTLPKAVSDHGEVLPVAGFGEKALYGEREVTDVTYYRDTQYVKPSAFYRSGMRYVWRTDYNLPKYIYPSEDFQSYIIQQELYDWDYNTPRWMFFKHNYAPLTFVKDQLKDESKKWGYSPFHAAGMQGIFFEMRVPDAVKKAMFRGYDAQEVIGLAMDGEFAAFHRFPAFSRWKWGEKEQSMSAALEKQMETRYGRKLRQSRYIGHLREGDGRVGIFEFEIRDGEAMVVIAWTQGGKVKATYVMTTEVDPNEGEFSVWNVDDDGEYGIPELLCIAFDKHDNVMLWFNHSAPESLNLFGLRQQGDQLQAFGEDQWYRYQE